MNNETPIYCGPLSHDFPYGSNWRWAWVGGFRLVNGRIEIAESDNFNIFDIEAASPSRFNDGVSLTVSAVANSTRELALYKGKIESAENDNLNIFDFDIEAASPSRFNYGDNPAIPAIPYTQRELALYRGSVLANSEHTAFYSPRGLDLLFSFLSDK